MFKSILRIAVGAGVLAVFVTSRDQGTTSTGTCDLLSTPPLVLPANSRRIAPPEWLPITIRSIARRVASVKIVSLVRP